MRIVPSILLVCGLFTTGPTALARTAVSDTARVDVRLCLQAPGEIDELIAVCKAALSVPGLSDGSRADLLVALGEMLREAGRDDEAVARFEAALALMPGSAAAHVGLGWALRSLGDAPSAFEAFGAAMGLHELNTALMGRAATGYETGALNAEEAVGMLDAALAEDPTENWVRREIGWIWMEEGDDARAATAFAAALEHDPRDAAAAYGAGRVSLDRNRPAEALAQFSVALDVEPDFISARTLQIIALRHLERYAEALSASDRMIRDLPDQVPGYVQRARVLLALDRRFEALVTLRYADGHIGPDNAVLYWIADTLYLEGRYDEALKAIRRAVALDGADHHDHLLMAQIAMELGDPGLALRAADAALGFNSGDPWGHFYAALAMVRRGATEEGRRRFEAALAAGLPRDRIGSFAEELIGAGAVEAAHELKVAYPE